MKKNIKKLMSFCLSLLFLGYTGIAQKPEKSAITPEQAKELDAVAVRDNPLSKLTVAEKNAAKDKAQALTTYVVKAVLHRTDPAKYPADEKENSPQAFAINAVKDVSAYTFNKMRDRVSGLMANPTKRAAILGKFKDIDFTKKSIHADIKKIMPAEFHPSIAVKDKDAASLQPHQENNFIGVERSATSDKNTPVFNKLDLVLRAIHCVDETNPESPGDDDIIIGGIIIGCSGNVAKARSIVSCHFDDGGYCNHGAIPFGTYNLNSTSNYPKTFYAIIQLIEADSDEQEVAQALSEIMGIAAAALAGTPYGAALAAVAAAVEVFSGLFFDDDAFYPYGVVLNLPSPSQFGSDGRSNNWATQNISDHGGTYRVGFYWQLKN